MQPQGGGHPEAHQTQPDAGNTHPNTHPNTGAHAGHDNRAARGKGGGDKGLGGRSRTDWVGWVAGWVGRRKTPEVPGSSRHSSTPVPRLIRDCWDNLYLDETKVISVARAGTMGHARRWTCASAHHVSRSCRRRTEADSHSHSHSFQVGTRTTILSLINLHLHWCMHWSLSPWVTRVSLRVSLLTSPPAATTHPPPASAHVTPTPVLPSCHHHYPRAPLIKSTN